MSDTPNSFLGVDDATRRALEPHGARLAHDLGKYIARAARNIAPGDVPRVVIEMLIKDLFLLDGEHRASEVFEALAKPFDPPLRAGWLRICEKNLEHIDALESEIRRGETMAIQQAAKLAVEIDDQLRQLASALGEAGD